MMHTKYENDAHAWAFEQANLLRAGRLSEIDVENIAEEIEAMGRSEHREVKNRMSVLLAHLLKWKFQPELQGKSWQLTIITQRNEINAVLDDNPSIKQNLSKNEWISNIWDRAVISAELETGLYSFPKNCLWDLNDVLKEGWLPE